MALDQQRQEEADYLAEKLGGIVKSSQATVERAEKIKIGLQIAQFIVVSVFGAAISFYAETIKSQQAAHNEEVSRQLKLVETKAVQAKVIQEFMSALVDPADKKRPLIALRAIEMFISEDFAFDLGKLLKTDVANERLDQLQAQVQPVNTSVAAATSTKKQGWVYLGSYKPTGRSDAMAWETRYFNFPKDKSPTDLEKERTEIQVLRNIGAANLRGLPPSNGGRLDSTSVIGRVVVTDTLKILDVEPVPNTFFYWAKVEIK